MEYEELKDLLKKWDIIIVSKGQQRVRGYNVDTYRKLAKQTENIDYDCDFNNGICQGRLMGHSGCCFRCAETFGYWTKEGGTIDEDSAQKMAGSWDVRTGFLREGEGCCLPRELRSPTCLYTFCSDEKMSGAERQLLFKIQYGANWS